MDLLDPSGGHHRHHHHRCAGNYTFTVPAGCYLVQVSDTHNVLDDFTDGPLGPNPGADNNNQQQPYPITIGGGATNTTADFGYIQNGVPGQFGIIGNQVWVETDRDGLYEPLNGEIGIAGVTVELLNARPARSSPPPSPAPTAATSSLPCPPPPTACASPMPSTSWPATTRP